LDLAPVFCQAQARTGGQPEHEDRLANSLGTTHEHAHLVGRIGRALGVLVGHHRDLTDRLGQVGRLERLLRSRLRDRFHELGELARDRLDLVQLLPCLVGQARALDDLAGHVVQADDRLVRLALHRLHEQGDSSGGVGRPLGQPLDLLGDVGESTAGVSGRSGLN
jgi:hypothetical protein